MNKFGLYAVDATRDNYLKGYRDPELNDAINISSVNSIYITTWKRTKLFYNGTECNNTINEKNNLGFYVANNRLLCNGDDVASSLSSLPSLSAIKFGEDDVLFGDAIVGVTTECINITLDDYEKLRAFKEVPGYTRYNPFVVYNIVSDVASAPKKSIVVPDGVEDMTYQSLVYIELSDCNYVDADKRKIDATSALAHNSLTDKTFTSGLTPELRVRYVTPVVKVGEYIEFEYFTDTKYYDSIHNRRISKTKNGAVVPNTFTLIVRNENGVVVYKNTTYAGQYKVAIAPFINNSDIGEHYLHFQIIDNEGRGSIEYFYDVMVNKADEPRIRELTAADLEHYGIVLDSGRDNIEQGYYNKIHLDTLFNDLATGNFKPDGITADGVLYDGVKMFNVNAAEKDLASDNNSKYYIDSHNIVGEKTITVNNQSVTVPDVRKFSNYYLMYYKKIGNTVQLGKLEPDGTFIPIIENGNTYGTWGSNNDYITTINRNYVIGNVTLGELLDSCELKPSYVEGGSLVQNSVNVRVKNKDTNVIYFQEIIIPVNNTEKQDCDFIFDWVFADGANIYRENNEYEGKIIRYWPHNLSSEETYNDLVAASTRVHRVRSLNIALFNAAAGKLANSFYDATVNGDNAEGYFYMAFFNGQCSQNESAGIYTAATEADYIAEDRYIEVPDNFIIDFNYASIRSTNITDVTNKTRLFPLLGVFNTHIKNLKIQGDYNYDSINEAFIKGCAQSVVWERSGMVSLAGSKYCSFTNIDSSGDCGYGFGSGPLSTASNTSRYKSKSISNSYMQFDSVGYINNSGVYVPYSDKICYDADTYADASDEEKQLLDGLEGDICLLTINQKNGADNYIEIYSDSEQSQQSNSNKPYYYTTNHKLHVRYARRNATDKIWTPYNYGFYIKSLYNGEYGYGAGLLHTFFIHCYSRTTNNNVATYTYIKTIKTKQLTNIRVPDGTTDIRITAYGLCSKTDGTIIMDSNNPTLAKYLTRLELSVHPYTTGLRITDIKAHDTRSSFYTGPSINTTIKNCECTNIARTPRGYKLTDYVIYHEENSNMTDAMCVFNMKVNYDEKTTWQYKETMNNSSVSSVFKIVPVYIKNYVGGTFYANRFVGACFKDCKFASFTHIAAKNRYDNYQNIMKRCTICGRTYYQRTLYRKSNNSLVDLGSSWGTMLNKSTSEGSGNTSKEPLRTEFVFEDCLITVPSYNSGYSAIPDPVFYKTVVDNLNPAMPAYTINDSYERQEQTINI